MVSGGLKKNVIKLLNKNIIEVSNEKKRKQKDYMDGGIKLNKYRCKFTSYCNFERNEYLRGIF